MYVFFLNRYPPKMHYKEGENSGSFYSFKGTKTLGNVSNSPTKKLKLEYEMFIRVYEDANE